MNIFLRRQFYYLKKIIWYYIAGFELLIFTFLLSQNEMIPIWLVIILGTLFLGGTIFISIFFTTNLFKKNICKEEIEAKILDNHRVSNNKDGITSVHYLITVEYFYKNKKYIQMIETMEGKREDEIENIYICKSFPKLIYIKEEKEENTKSEYAFK